VHIEACKDILGILNAIRSLGCVPGITLNPDTPASEIQPYIPLVGLVLVMTVVPGYSGQEFMPEMLPKIAQIRRMLDNIHSSAWLEVDGGISTQTLQAVRNAGADAFVAAKSVFWNPEGISTGIKSLRKLLEPDNKDL
jgi:ribulose-phosphate 3-epimerase